jgi:hypothetical protein
MKPPEVSFDEQQDALRGRVMMRTMPRIAGIWLLLLLLVAGCADSGAASDNDSRGVFYGGISGGGSRP